ncbi:hypothetical protein BH23ACT6_BH23ACT6_15560 [soil metagenome]
MTWQLWRKELADRWPLAAGVGGLLIVFSAIAFAIYAPMASTLDAVAATFPREILTIIGGIAPGGYVVSQLFNVLGPIMVVALAVTIGTSVLAGEEDDGTLGLLLAHPVRRGTLLAIKGGVVLTLMAITTTLFFVGVATSAAYQGVPLDGGLIAAACLHLYFLAACFAMISLAAGAATGRAGVAGAIAGAVTVVSYLTATMLPVAGFEGWARISPWHYYNGSDPLTNGIDGTHLVVLIGLGVLAALVSWVTFSRRDLRG